MTKIRINDEAHIASGFERLNEPNGKPSIYVLEGDWYEVEASDDDGNKYRVIWDLDHDGELNERNWRSILSIDEIGKSYLIESYDDYEVVID